MFVPRSICRTVYVHISDCVCESTWICVCVQASVRRSCAELWSEAGFCLLWKYYCKCLLLQHERQWECCVPCGPAKSGCRGVCERKEFFFNAHSLCSHRPAPSEARCILGSGEAYWSWLVPAESQIEFWQAGETGSQRERPPPHAPSCPLQQTIEAAWQELFKTLHTLHSSFCHTNVGTHTHSL